MHLYHRLEAQVSNIVGAVSGCLDCPSPLLHRSCQCHNGHIGFNLGEPPESHRKLFVFLSRASKINMHDTDVP